MRIGIISDTHGLLRPEVFDRFAGVEHILHAGDIGDPELLLELGALAPVTAVWGNTDGFALRHELPEVGRVRLEEVETVVIHGQQWGSPTPQRAAEAYPDAGLVVFGHSHRPALERIGTVLAVNPGSAGPPRFGMSPTLAVAEIRGADVEVELITLAR